MRFIIRKAKKSLGMQETQNVTILVWEFPVPNLQHFRNKPVKRPPLSKSLNVHPNKNISIRSFDLCEHSVSKNRPSTKRTWLPLLDTMSSTTTHRHWIREAGVSPKSSWPLIICGGSRSWRLGGSPASVQWKLNFKHTISVVWIVRKRSRSSSSSSSSSCCCCCWSYPGT